MGSIVPRQPASANAWKCFVKELLRPYRACAHAGSGAAGGRILGEQMGQEVIVIFPDLIIGATALHIGFAVVTLNVRHFQPIPRPFGSSFSGAKLQSVCNHLA